MNRTPPIIETVSSGASPLSGVLPRLSGLQRQGPSLGAPLTPSSPTRAALRKPPGEGHDASGEASPQASPRPEGAQELRSGTSRPRLLLLEDNGDTAELMRVLLDDEYELALADTYDKALSLVRTQPFDVLVLDINLKGPRTGADLLQAVREMPEYRNVPAIACTAYATTPEQVSFADAGFDGYLRKPFEIDDLTATIEQVLRDRRAQ